MRLRNYSWIAALFVSVGVAHASSILNGGFEVPGIGTATFVEYCPGGEPAGFGWTILSNSCSDVFSQGVFGTTATVYEGNQALDLVGIGTQGEIAQTFATTPGATYKVTFVYGNNSIFTESASADVTVTDGSNILLSSGVTHSTTTTSNVNWTLYSHSFTATGLSATLDFTETYGNANGGLLLDDVSVDLDPVPEPGALPLSAMGLLAGILGFRIRRRSCRA